MGQPQTAVAPPEPAVAMARRGALFMWGFALVWALVGLGGASGLGLLPAVAVIGAGLTAGVLLPFTDRRGPQGQASPARLAPDFQRKFRQVGIAQGVLIGLVVAGFVVISQPQFITPAVALGVGLHFWPLARIFDQPHFRTACWRLVVVAALGLLAAAVSGPELAQAVTGLGAAAVLIAAGAGAGGWATRNQAA